MWGKGADGRALERAEEPRTDCGMRGSCPSERLKENTAISPLVTLSALHSESGPEDTQGQNSTKHEQGDETEAHRAGGSVAALQDREQTKHSQQDRVLTHSRGSCYTPREQPSLGREGTHSSDIYTMGLFPELSTHQILTQSNAYACLWVKRFVSPPS